MRRWFASQLVALAVIASAPSASAQQGAGTDLERAQALFDAALKMMQNGEYAPACALLEQSDKLDPGMGTRFRLAECFEKVGRVASAWKAFLDVASAAKQVRNADRERVARQRAAALEPRVAKLVIRVPETVAALPGLDVKLDGEPVAQDIWSKATPVDPGEHSVDVSAPGKLPWHGSVLVDKQGKAFEVEVPNLGDGPREASVPVPTQPPTATVAPEPDGNIFWTNRRLVSAAVGVAGGAGLIVAGVFSARASSQWTDAKSHCVGGDETQCDDDGIELGGKARTSANIATGFFIGGAAVLSAGVILFLTAPSGPSAKASLQLYPVVRPGEGGAMIRATF